MACDRFQGQVVEWSGTDEFNGDPGVEKVSGEGFAGEQRSKPFSGFPEICRLGYRSDALLQAMRHSYLASEGKPSRNSKFFREMACAGWFKNVRPLRHTVRSGKRGGLGKNVNEGSSKTWKIGVSQDNSGKTNKKVSKAWEPGKSQVKGFDEVKGRGAQGRCRTRGGLLIRVGSAGGDYETNELEEIDG